MINLACKDISPDTTCTFEVAGATATDAAQMMLAHARTEHATDIVAMSDEDAIKLFETKVRP